jgi:hypothetical protein
MEGLSATQSHTWPHNHTACVYLSLDVCPRQLSLRVAPVLRQDFNNYGVIDGLPEVSGERIEKLKTVLTRVC